MKNREYRALIVAVLVLAMTAGSMKETTSYAHSEATKKPAASEMAETKKAGHTNSSVKAKKDETVYIKVDSTGAVNSITVSDQLKNITDLKKIEDVSELQDIENVKGEETYTRENEKLVWQVDSKEICYQGTISKEIPVGIKITYTLDGKEINADELEGKSGHLKIHYAYFNATAEEEKYIPFVMATGLILDTEKFANVTIDQGKIISDGDRDIVISMGIPQMEEELGTEDFNIPDSFTIEADVTDYEAVEGITIATNDIFNAISKDQLNSVDDLKESMSELQKASKQLVDGSGELKNGLDSLLEATGPLASGIDSLANGSNTLKEGTESLQSGTEQLKSGSKSLANGTDKLAAGAVSLSMGASQVADGVKNAFDGSGQLASGAEQLNTGMATMQEQSGEGVTKIGEGAGLLSKGIDQAADGASSLKSGIDNAVSTAAILNEGLSTASASASQLVSSAANIQNSLSAIAAENNYAEEAGILQELINTSSDEEVKTKLMSVMNGMETKHSMINGAISQATGEAENLTSGASGLAGQLGTEGQIGSGVAGLSAGLVQLQSGADHLNTVLGENLKTGALQLQSGISEMASTLDSGTKQLVEGAGALVTGTQNLNAGLGTLNEGAVQVSAGGLELSSNMKSADEGAKSVAEGAERLSVGATDLNKGTVTFVNGMGTLKNGASGLIGGVQKLADGAIELNRGMIQFNEEGVERLVYAVGGDVDGLLDKMNRMLDASKSYESFSGISEEMDGEVKFMFVMDK